MDNNLSPEENDKKGILIGHGNPHGVLSEEMRKVVISGAPLGKASLSAAPTSPMVLFTLNIFMRLR